MIKGLFSIIIPTYNSAEYICDTINSVVAQTYGQYEILLIDDCSEDRLAEVVFSSFNNIRNIRLFVNEKKEGPNFSRNRGIIEAKGEYIVFLDSDDCLDEKALLVLSKKLVETTVDFVSFGFEFVSVDSRILGKRNFDIGEISNASLVRDYYTGLVSTVCWNKVYRRSFLIEKDITFIPDLVHGRDSLFVLNCCLKAKSALFISDILYYSTVRPQSFSRVFSIKNLNSIRSNVNLVRKISKDWNIDKCLVDCYVAKQFRYILMVSAFRLSFVDYFKGYFLFFTDKEIWVLFRPCVIQKSTLFRNSVSILLLFPFLIYPLVWVLKSLNIRPY